MKKIVQIIMIILLIFVQLFSKTRVSEIDSSSSLVVLIHGIFDRSNNMWRVEKKLNDNGYSVLNFDYYSTKWSMDTVVSKLEKELKQISPRYENIFWVTHSMGGLVVRSYLSQNKMDKFKSLVMIAPPNKGSVLAERAKNFPPYKWLSGEAGQNLGKDSLDYLEIFPPPDIPFGIIAGGIGTKEGLNPTVPGDDDGVVSVVETQLKGYSDFIVISGFHSTLILQDKVINQILFFLKDGHFRL